MFRGVIRLFEHSFALIRIFLLISTVCFIPRFFITTNKDVLPLFLRSPSSGSFTLGLENLKKEFIMQICPNKNIIKIGLITNSQATDQHGTSNVDLLIQKDLTISKIFYPKYMFSGQEPFAQDLPHDDGIERHVLYNQGFNKSMLAELDLLLIDLPDVGIGYGHAISLLFETIHMAVAYALPVVVLDRPNILGQKIEGSLCHPLHQHIPIKLPVRHGMTIAELAQFYNMQVLNGMAQMHIVPMYDYHRVNVSSSCIQHLANMTTVNTVYGFSICGILAQVAPFDIGLDTEYPYGCIMLPESVEFPEQRWYQLQVILRKLGVNSSFCRHFSESRNEVCRGLRLHIMNINLVDSFRAVLVILEFFKCSGVVLAFSDYFDQAVGTPLIRHYIQGKISKKKLVGSINQDLESFYRAAFGAFMYYPLPQVSLI